MKLYRVWKRHFSPKDCEESIECFLVAQNDNDAYDWIDEHQNFGMWKDRNEDDDLYDLYDEDYNVIGQESYKERMLRTKGEFFDPDAEADDLYYGVTHYGWEEVDSSKDLIEEVEVLKRLNFIKFTSNEKYQEFIKSKKIESF